VNDRFFSVNDRFAARKTTPGKDPREHSPFLPEKFRLFGLVSDFFVLSSRLHIHYSIQKAFAYMQNTSGL